jgi:hypothetical protein
MLEPLKIDELPCELMVNGIPVQSVHIRWLPASADDSHVLMTIIKLDRSLCTTDSSSR